MPSIFLRHAVHFKFHLALWSNCVQCSWVWSLEFYILSKESCDAFLSITAECFWMQSMEMKWWSDGYTGKIQIHVYWNKNVVKFTNGFWTKDEKKIRIIVRTNAVPNNIINKFKINCHLFGIESSNLNDTKVETAHNFL